MNDIPEAFIETGVRLSLLLLGWGSLFFLIIVVVSTIASFRRDSDFAGFVALIAGVCLAFTGVGWLIDLWPYDGKYHHYYEVSGQVTSVSNVLSEADGELTRQPVVTLDTVERPLVVDDPRAVSLLDKNVVLRCTVGWQYQAADTYTCKVVDFDTTP